MRRLTLGLVLLLASILHAAKVVRLYNPWLAYESAVANTIHLVNYYPLPAFDANSNTNVFRSTGSPWLELVLPALPAGPLNFVVVANPGAVYPFNQSFGTNGIGGGDMDLGTPLQSKDTVWIVPSSLPNGPAKILTAAPKQTTILLWNPWEYDASSQRPGMNVEGGGWNPMDSVPTRPGWYSAQALGYTNLSVQFRNQDGSKSLGTMGIGLPLPILLDSVGNRNDTVWVWTSLEPNGAPRSAAAAPLMKTVMVFNPWDGKLPFQKPRISFGGPSLPMVTESEYCGWSSFQFVSRPLSVLFSGSRTNESYGAGGLGSSTVIDVSQALQLTDTAWIAPELVTGKPKVTVAYTGEKGQCEIALLAATIRDFDASHPNFEEDAVCGVVKGMVSKVLGPDRELIRGTNHCANLGVEDDTRLTIDWFKDNPATNSTTCRDIPLAIDANSGNYKYENSAYFPIDDFDTLPDGTPNVHNQKLLADDNKLHNFHYCLESHGVFDYQRGQVFKFRGDDDVWFYIDGRLAVDLGGRHAAAPASVDLDTMGLVAGRTYNFDFFYCERHTGAANMLIETSMNLRTPSGFKVFDTTRTQVRTTYDLYVSQRLGQGCSASQQLRRTSGLFLLTGPGISPPQTLNAGVTHGGISIDPNLSRITVDLGGMTGFAPGTYTILIRPAGADTAGTRSVVFTIPPILARPYFVDKPAYSGYIGTAVKVSVVSRTSAGVVDPNATTFVLHPISGLSYYRDSLRTSLIRPGDTLWTGANGIPRQIWVRGDAAGTYTLRTGFGLNDTVDTYPSVVFTDRKVRYTDSLGNAYSTLPALDADVRTPVAIWVEVVSGNSVCVSCSDSLVLTAIPGVIFRGSANGNAIDGIRLTGGKAKIWIYGTRPVENGWFTSTISDRSAYATWSPVRFRAPSLRFTDSLGNTLLDLAATAGEPRKVWLQAQGVSGLCLACNQEIVLSSTDPEVVLLGGPAGPSISKTTLVGGRSGIWISGGSTTPQGAFAIARSDSLWAIDSLPMHWVAQGPDSAFWSDVDGDGAADRLDVFLHHKWKPNSSVSVSWPTASPLFSADSGARVVSGDSLHIHWIFSKGLTPLTTQSNGSRGVLKWDGRSEYNFAISDRIAPVAVKARLRYGSTFDTIRISSSEPLSPGFSATDDVVRQFTAGTWVRATPSVAYFDPASGELILVYPAEDPNLPVPGDSLRFSSSGAVRDLLGNIPDENSRRVILQGTDRPPRAAVMQDSDGDGRADRVVLRFTNPLRNTKSFAFRWPGPGGLETRLALTADAQTDSGGRILTFNLPPWQYGYTSCPQAGCQNLGTLFASQQGDTSSQMFAIQDEVAAVPVTAKLRYTGTPGAPDTLTVVMSEPVTGSKQIGSPWFSFGNPGKDEFGQIVPWTGFVGDGPIGTDSRTIVLLVDSNFHTVKGDSLRATAAQKGGTLQDLSGNQSGQRAAWIPIVFGPHPLLVEWRTMPPLRVYNDWSIPTDEDRLQIFVRGSSGQAWTRLDGSAIRQDTSHYAGIYLKLNRSLSGAAYVYDNIGVFVAQIELDPLRKAAENGSIPTDSRGNYEVWVAWNATTLGSNGNQIAPGGIYVFRVMAHHTEEGRLLVLNRTFNVGWKRKN